MCLQAKEKDIITICGDFEAIPVTDRSVGAAIFVESIHHRLSDNSLMKELKRVLMPNSILLLVKQTKWYFEPRNILAQFVCRADRSREYTSTFPQEIHFRPFQRLNKVTVWSEQIVTPDFVYQAASEAFLSYWEDIDESERCIIAHTAKEIASREKRIRLIRCHEIHSFKYVADSCVIRRTEYSPTNGSSEPRKLSR